MRWIVPAFAAGFAASSCLAADAPQPVNTAHLQVKYLFESEKPGLPPLPRYDVRSGKDFSTLLSSKARPAVQLRVHAIDSSPDGRVVLIREEAAEGLRPFRWTLIYRSPEPTDLPKFHEIFEVVTQQGEASERLISNRGTIHHADQNRVAEVFSTRLELTKLANDHLIFTGDAESYRLNFEDCFANFPKPQG